MSSSNPPSSLLGAPHFAVLDQFYPEANGKIANALQVDVTDMEISMVDKMKYSPNFLFSLTVRVSGCQTHSCGVSVGEKMNTMVLEIEKALGLNWITVSRSTTTDVHIVDHAGDTIPLQVLLQKKKDTTNNNNNNVQKDPPSDNDKRLSDGAIAGIVIGVSMAFVIAIFATHKVSFEKGKQHERDNNSNLFKGAGGAEQT